MSGQRRNTGRRGAARGFTLVELLVAMAIFVTVMGSVALLFNAAIRASKQGFQNQEAFEVARGVMDVIERDLSRAFTSREHGDVFSFYGTPIGFTFVGLISTEGQPNVGRVTYVIYHDPFEQLAGAISTYESVSGEQINTYNLIRYVEPGVDNLDSYPIPWEQDLTPDDAFDVSLQTYIDDNVNTLCPNNDAGCRLNAERAFKGEMWIRMLAGGDRSLGIPSAWDTLDVFVGNPNDPNDDLRPGDFTIAENIRFLRGDGIVCAATRDILFDPDGLGVELDFDDRLVRRTRQTASGPVTEVCAEYVSEANRIPMFRPLDPINVNPGPIPRPNTGPLPFFRYWDLGEGSISGEIQPNARDYWNDGRVVAQSGLGRAVGSPLDARLPIAVTVDITLFFKSPYPGAPDFNRRFTQRIDIPTGYRRVYDTLEEEITGS